MPRLSALARPGHRGAPVDWLIVGLGNPGPEYAGTRHNVGFAVAERLAARWELPKLKSKFSGLLTEGRAGPEGPRVALLLPQTYMNEAGDSVGPARGTFGLPLERVLVIHDEIDLPFGEIRVRVGVGRPPTTDPDRVAAYVLGRFREPKEEVGLLIEQAADAAEEIVRNGPPS